MRQILISENNNNLKYKISGEHFIGKMKLYMSKGKFIVISNLEFIKNKETIKKLCNFYKYKIIEDMSCIVQNLDNYERIVIFGDIHGYYNIFIKAYNELVSDDTFVIFTGDYINRGYENIEMADFLYSIKDKKNVKLIEGNHDKFFWEYGCSRNIINNVKFKALFKEFNENKYPVKKAKEISCSFKEMFIFDYKGNKYFVSHGGLPIFPKYPQLINTEKYIMGVGNDYIKVDEMFNEKYNDSNFYQIHGHSNLYSIKPDKYKHSINLEGGVEIGGNLVAFEITDKYSKSYFYKNSKKIIINYFSQL